MSNSFDSASVFVDRFSKKSIFIPAYSIITSLDLAKIFISHVLFKNGLPAGIVSDRGSLFFSSFWTQSCNQLKILRDLSNTLQTETDEQKERVNQIIEQYICIDFSYHQDYWNIWHPLAEFSYNNAEHLSTKQSPFFAIYGKSPSFDSIHISQDTPAEKLEKKSNQYRKL
ncbi:hypothetical protein O181_033833 [Austropuccinia psidii MF-1]|uniref:Integrase catalytic domain-containing protein n=1 Tax=Austropuccinia psidii MF-1 TaxID=1389203 RepID=A0A9Q3D297_9BASI|nr:hypothetical protein [Austropuccinia psidii MF-1]